MASIISAGTTSATALNMSADTTGVLQLASNNGTVGLTLNASQQVGIGTASPANLFHVSTSTASNSKFEQTGTGANYITLRSNGSDRAFIGLENSSGTGLFGGGTAYGLSIGTTGASNIAFATNNTVRASLDTNGNFLLGTSTTAGPGTLAIVAGKHYTQAQTLVIANNSATAIVTLTEGSFIIISAYVDTNMYASASVLCRNGALVVTYINQDANSFCGFSGSGQSLRITNTGTGGSRTANVNYIQIL